MSDKSGGRWNTSDGYLDTEYEQFLAQDRIKRPKKLIKSEKQVDKEILNVDMSTLNAHGIAKVLDKEENMKFLHLFISKNTIDLLTPYCRMQNLSVRQFFWVCIYGVITGKIILPDKSEYRKKLIDWKDDDRYWVEIPKTELGE